MQKIPTDMRTSGARPGREESAQALENTSGRGKLYPVPDEVTGWSWGAFTLSWIWAIGNRTWLGLLALIPGIGLIVRIILGVNGRKWAWENTRWDSVDHFNRVQRRWSIWGGLLLGLALFGIAAAVAIPAYQNYQLRQPLAASLAYANEASAAVGRYVVSHRAMPRSLEVTDLLASRPAAVQQVEIDRRTGWLAFTLDAGYLRGKAFYLAPAIEADGTLSWRCLHGDVPKHLLPEECKYNTADSLGM